MFKYNIQGRDQDVNMQNLHGPPVTFESEGGWLRPAKRTGGFAGSMPRRAACRNMKLAARVVQIRVTERAADPPISYPVRIFERFAIGLFPRHFSVIFVELKITSRVCQEDL